jgi:hypothetical protein
MNSTGANWLLLSATHIAKSFCFDLKNAHFSLFMTFHFFAKAKIIFANS